MSTETQTGTSTGTATGFASWQAGLVGGLVGAVGFGLVMMFGISDPVLEQAIPAMYGVEGPALGIGWAAHLAHGAILGIGFAGARGLDATVDVAADYGQAGLLGLSYGVFLWMLLGVVIMPIWIFAAGFASPPVPHVSVPSLLGHALFGVLLGIVYSILVAQ